MPEDDLIPDAPEAAGISEADLYEGQPDECAYIDTALNVLSTFDAMDVEVMTSTSKRRIQQMRRWAIRIAHHNMKLLYDYHFDDDAKTEEE